MKKIIGILICMLVFASVFSTTTASIKLLSNRESDKINSTNNGEDPIQAIVEAEQIDGRTWNIKVYAHNPLDEDITIKISPISVKSRLYSLDSRIYLFERLGPSNNEALKFLLLRFYILNSYKYNKVVPSHDKILLDEYTFNGESNIPFRFLLYLIYRIKTPRILPEGDYYLEIDIKYKLEEGIDYFRINSDPVLIHLEAP